MEFLRKTVITVIVIAVIFQSSFCWLLPRKISFFEKWVFPQRKDKKYLMSVRLAFLVWMLRTVLKNKSSPNRSFIPHKSCFCSLRLVILSLPTRGFLLLRLVFLSQNNRSLSQRFSPFLSEIFIFSLRKFSSFSLLRLIFCKYF